MSSIGRVKPYVFSGYDPDPNMVALRAPGFPPPQDRPQPSDMYINKVNPDLIELWVFGFVQSATVASWERVDSGDGPPGVPGTQWYTGDGPPPDPFPGANDGDLYLDNLTGDYYRLTGTGQVGVRSVVPGTYTSFVPGE